MTEWGITLEAAVVRQLHITKPIGHYFLVLGNVKAMSFLQLVYVDGVAVGGTFTACVIGGIGNQYLGSLVSQWQGEVSRMGTDPALMVAGYIVNQR